MSGCVPYAASPIIPISVPYSLAPIPYSPIPKQIVKQIAQLQGLKDLQKTAAEAGAKGETIKDTLRGSRGT